MNDPAATAAARAAGLVASSAYTHPLADLDQANTSTARQLMLPWRWSLPMAVIQPVMRLKSAGRSNTSLRRFAQSCGRCQPVRQGKAGWTRSFSRWMRACALKPFHRNPDRQIQHLPGVLQGRDLGLNQVDGRSQDSQRSDLWQSMEAHQVCKQVFQAFSPYRL